MLLRLPLQSILLHVVLWSICIQRSRQVRETNLNMLNRSQQPHSGTSSLEEVCLHNEASDRYLRIQGRALVDACGESGRDDIRLIIQTLSLNGSVSIRGKDSNFYLCINKRGDIVGRKRMKTESNLMCVFMMHTANGKIELEPLQFTDMYVGFRRTGQTKNAKRVKHLTKYSLFGKDYGCDNYGNEERLTGEVREAIQVIRERLANAPPGS